MSPEEKELFLIVWKAFAIITIPLMIVCITIFCHSTWVLGRRMRLRPPPPPPMRD